MTQTITNFARKLNILRTDGSVESFEWSERPTISECTLMRRADPTIAAIGYGDHATRAGQPDLSWIGNYTTEHGAAIAAQEKKNDDNLTNKEQRR